jgi:hypothetical protein
MLPVTAAIAGAKSKLSVYSAYAAPETKPPAKLHAVCSVIRSRHPGFRNGGRGGATPNKEPGGRAGVGGGSITMLSGRDVDVDTDVAGRENTPIAGGGADDL